MQRITFKDLYKDIMDYILLNLIFLATVLLTAMVTFGAALKALFYVSRRLSAHDLQVSVWRDFFKSFKEEFGLSTLIWFCTVLLGLSAYFGFLNAMENEQMIVLVFLIVSVLFALVYLLYLYPLLSWFVHPSRKALFQNAFILLGRHPFTSIMLLGSVAAVVGLFILFEGTILFSIGMFAWMNTVHLMRALKPYINDLTQSEDQTQEE